MEKIRIIPLAIMLLTCFCFSRCKKDHSPASDNPNGLPNTTQTGANIFACLVNGQKFIAFYDGIHSKAGFDGELSKNGFAYDTLGIVGSPKFKNYFAGLGLSINGNLHQNSKYNVNSIEAVSILGTDSTCFGISFNVTTAYAIEGMIQLNKFDTINKIVSGTFNCIIPILNCDTLHITDGRFDYQYY